MSELASKLKTSAFNSTAYRILQILRWLWESPMSVEELNQRFVSDPLIGKRLSTDSIWLYINTLKKLGCEISRPAPSNRFKYELERHPYGIPLEETELLSLVKAKALAEELCSYEEIICLDGFLKKVLEQNTLPNPENIAGELFFQNKEVDYERQRGLITSLRVFIADKTLVRISYDSPINGLRDILLLPEELSYRRGVLYLRGNRPEKQDPSMLRLDRILRVEAEERPEVRSQLLDRQNTKPTVIIHLFNITPLAFEGLGMGEETQYFSKAMPRYLQVTLQTRDFFILTQKLLELGTPFKIVKPLDFRDEMLNTLLSMKKVYEDKHD